MAQQKRIWRDSQHPRDAKGRFAKRGGAAWIKRAAAELTSAADAGSTRSASGRPQISRSAKAGVVLQAHADGGRPSAVRVPKAVITPAPTVNAAAFNAPGTPAARSMLPKKRTPRPSPGAAALIAARREEQAPQMAAMVAARTAPEGAPVPGAADYASMRQHTLVSLARQAGVPHRNRSRTDIANDLAARDAKVKADRKAKLNPSDVGTDSRTPEKLQGHADRLEAEADAARAAGRMQEAWDKSGRAERFRRSAEAARAVDTPRVTSNNGGMTSTTSDLDDIKARLEKARLSRDRVAYAAVRAELEAHGKENDARLRKIVKGYKDRGEPLPDPVGRILADLKRTMDEINAGERTPTTGRKQIPRDTKVRVIEATSAKAAPKTDPPVMQRITPGQVAVPETGPIISDREDAQLKSLVSNMPAPLQNLGRQWAEAVRSGGDAGPLASQLNDRLRTRDRQGTANIRTLVVGATDVSRRRANARSMAERLRKPDSVAKYGDEFATITPTEVMQLGLVGREGGIDTPEMARERLATLRRTGQIMPPGRIDGEDGVMDSPDFTAARAALAPATTPAPTEREAKLAAKRAELEAATQRFHAEANRQVGGSSKRKSFGVRIDAQLRRAGEHHRDMERLEREIKALERPEPPKVGPVNFDDIKPGGIIKRDGQLYRVVKVNARSVKVEMPPGMDDLFKKDKKITEVHPPRADAAPAAAPARARITPDAKRGALARLDTSRVKSQNGGMTTPAPTEAKKMTVNEAGLQDGDRVWIFAVMSDSGVGFTPRTPERGTPILATVQTVQNERYGRAKGTRVTSFIDEDGNNVGGGSPAAKHWLAPVGASTEQGAPTVAAPTAMEPERTTVKGAGLEPGDRMRLWGANGPKDGTLRKNGAKYEFVPDDGGTPFAMTPSVRQPMQRLSNMAPGNGSPAAPAATPAPATMPDPVSTELRERLEHFTPAERDRLRAEAQELRTARDETAAGAWRAVLESAEQDRLSGTGRYARTAPAALPPSAQRALSEAVTRPDGAINAPAQVKAMLRARGLIESAGPASGNQDRLTAAGRIQAPAGVGPGTVPVGVPAAPAGTSPGAVPAGGAKMNKAQMDAVQARGANNMIIVRNPATLDTMIRNGWVTPETRMQANTSASDARPRIGYLTPEGLRAAGIEPTPAGVGPGSVPIGGTDADRRAARPRMEGETDRAYAIRTAPSRGAALRMLAGNSLAGLRAIARDENVVTRSGDSKAGLIERLMRALYDRHADSVAITNMVNRGR